MRDASAGCVHHSEVVLRGDVSLFSCEPKPLERLFVILWNTMTMLVHPSDIVLCVGDSFSAASRNILIASALSFGTPNPR